ncbi:DNA polymerase III subunit gamma and tau [Phycicoccus sp. M110.8]|uniref:DNA polymerase III subunit gamma and tau n=1 Tax=Phycicoccus sp. M110.8 TaxID=3075433 RepID=UPI0028FD0A7A|nr:DNA polymerase III subunit gamma and tau [Phycicoccus sp. M110.8]MDU0313977.1 DNA polymerase III subunit gamma and tau [Phycicoccus sp. M110.8]
MSTALYRRYRPETFADVIGQEHVTEPLMQALRTGRVNHAYLFSGPRGCGKTTSARILARCLNCEQGPTPTPCGTCDSCVALARGGSGSVDVIEIDAASHGGVDDARDLRERASYGPAQSRFKIYIIDEAHMVTPQGFNALLKIVEEPPEHVKFVFATTEPEKVIGTIRSRTHHYPFRLVPPGQLTDYMARMCEQEGVAVAPGVLSFVTRAGGGSVRDSLSVLDQLIAGSGEEGLTYEGAASLLGFTDNELLDAIVDAFAAGDAAGVFHQVDRVIETGLDPRRFVEDLLERLRDLIVVAAVPDGASSVLRGLPEDQLERMRQQAAAFGGGALSRAADIVNAGLTEMTGATAPRLQLELICARVLLPAASGESGYAARLDRLERRLDVEGVPSVTRSPGTPIATVPMPASAPASRPAAPESPSAAPAPAASAAPAAPAPAASAPAAAPSSPAAAAPASDPAQAAPPAPSPAGHAPAAEAAPTRAPGDERGRPGPGQGGHAATAERAAGGSVPEAQRSQQAPAASPGRSASTPPAAPEPAPGPSPAHGGIDTAAIRRAWPDILGWIFKHKRTTWTLLSEHATVHDYDGSKVVLAISTVGIAHTFRSGPHADLVRQALIDVLGVDARVEGIPVPDAAASAPSGASHPIVTPGQPDDDADPAGAPGPTRQQGTGQSAAPGPASRPSGGDAGSAYERSADMGLPAAPPPESGGGGWASAASAPDSGPSWAAPEPGTGPSSASQASSSAQAAAPAPSGGQAGQSLLARAQAAVAAEQPVDAPRRVADDSVVSADDEDIEELGDVGRPVIERILGGRVIDEGR